MIPLFLGLTAANLLVMSVVFVLGYSTKREAGTVHDYHLLLGLGSGLLATMTHMVVYMYHMATARWLAAATDKAGAEPARFVGPALRRKRRAFVVVIGVVVWTMLTMFTGAGADPQPNRWWPGEVHLTAAAVCIAANLGAAVAEFRLIRGQGRLMDDALAALASRDRAAAGPSKPDS